MLLALVACSYHLDVLQLLLMSYIVKCFTWIVYLMLLFYNVIHNYLGISGLHL